MYKPKQVTFTFPSGTDQNQLLQEFCIKQEIKLNNCIDIITDRQLDQNGYRYRIKPPNIPILVHPSPDLPVSPSLWVSFPSLPGVQVSRRRIMMEIEMMKHPTAVYFSYIGIQSTPHEFAATRKQSAQKFHRL